MNMHIRPSSPRVNNSLFFPAILLALFLAPVMHAQTFTTLFTFTGSNGSLGTSGLVANAAGDLFGTTAYGGDLNCNPSFPPPGCGVVFKLSTSDQETVMHAFTGLSDGQQPSSTVVLAGGNIYGTTSQGGGPNNYGTVFVLNSQGKEINQYDFKGGSTDVSFPTASVVPGPGGFFFGTGYFNGVSNMGGVFKLEFNNGVARDRLLHSFTGGSTDGAHPNSPVVFQNGTAYGTTVYGGSGSCNNGFDTGCGVVYSLTPSGTESIVYSFSGPDGDGPGALIPDGNGGFYGSTNSGGASNNGTVFDISTSGVLTTLYSFKGSPDPTGVAGLQMDASGNLFGITPVGGANNDGAIFELSPNGQGGWTETVLYSFTGGADGTGPQPGFVLNQQTRTIYGLTIEGGDTSCFTPYGCGTVFSLTY
jgi:uncharacterized repeat protein (TIGR03803 family)